jgi:Cu/Ag efflux protein CusF
MNTWTIRLALIAVIGCNVTVLACSQNATERRTAKPNFSERISRDAVTGDVKDVGKNYVSIRQDNGETLKVRVNDNTKMDPVTEGDHVKAFVTDDGYASTIQRTPR